MSTAPPSTVATSLMRAWIARAVLWSRRNPAEAIQIAVVGAVVLWLIAIGAAPIGGQWLLFALYAATFPLHIWDADGGPSLLASLSYAAKVALALAPVAVVAYSAPRLRILAASYAAGVIVISVAFVRACPSTGHWVAAVALSVLGAALARVRRLRWAAALPLLVLLVDPASRHGTSQSEGGELAERCAANDGERPAGLQPDQLTPRYYGIHPFDDGWVLLTGEAPEDGRFLGLPHHGRGSWWLRRGEDGRLAFAGPSAATGNVWTSCRLDGARWLMRASHLMAVQAPGADTAESIRRFPLPTIGFDATGSACDEEGRRVYVSDVLDGRLIEVSPDGDFPARYRADSISVRAGPIDRRADGRLVLIDFQRIIVYAPDEARVLSATPASVVSSSLALCAVDGAAAVPDLAGRLRVFRTTEDGAYAFDWGLDLFAPRFAAFSPDCSFLGVTSADDRHVWIVERSSGSVIETFEVGPTIRGVAFLGPRELAVADACTVTTLRF